MLLCSVPVASTVKAHEPPHGLALLWPEGVVDDDPVVLTNRGLVYSRDRTSSSYSLRCNESYDVQTGSEQPHALLDDLGNLVIASRVRPASQACVRATSDRGCTWKLPTGLPDVACGAFLQDKALPSRLLIATQIYTEPSFLFESLDYGRSWAAKAENAQYTTYDGALLGSPDGQHLFASGHRYDVPTRKLHAAWGESVDGGKTWVDSDLDTERFPLAFHPTDPSIVFAREPLPLLTIDPKDKLLRSSDGGKTFETVLEVGQINAFSSTPDGSILWVGGERKGLYESRDAGKTWKRIHEDTIIGIFCLQYRKDTLWACTRMAPNTSGIWSSSDRGESFRELLSFEDVTSQVSCEPAAQAVCEIPWRDWTYELLTDWDDAGVPPSDAGAAVDASVSGLDAGHDAADASTVDSAVDAGSQPRKSDDGCSAAPRGGSGSQVPLWLLSALALGQRRKRRGA